MSKKQSEKESLFDFFNYIYNNYESPNFLNRSIDSLSYISKLENSWDEDYHFLCKCNKIPILKFFYKWEY